MCGRFFRHDVSWAEYHSALSLIEPDQPDLFGSAYNVAPTQVAPIFRRDDDAPDQLVVSSARWGLVPYWWRKDLKEMKFSTFNARSEGLKASKVFRQPYQKKRALVPLSGFYEWKGPKGQKQPYAIGLRNRRWFAVAGLWSRALINDQPLESFTILTTEPNDLMADIHNRMPVILRPEDYGRWLDPEIDDPAELLKPYEAAEMDAWPVGKAVGQVRNQGPNLIKPVD
ncbi:MAG: SOS response-associated peptidase [Pseudomonadota bacterium]